jgi:gluconolactonase
MLYPVSEVRIFATGLDHPEGVAVGSDGTVYAGGEAGQVYRISPDGKRVETIASTGGFCLGITLDQEDNVIVCDCGNRMLYKITQSGEVSVLADSADGRPFSNPNFSVFDSRGNLYFSDSGDWKKSTGVIYRLSPDGKVTLFAGGTFHFANGLALDADEKYLYVVESTLNRVLRIKIRSDLTAAPPEVFVEDIASVPDGLAFDQAGNLYVTTYGSSAVYRVSPQGKVSLLCQDVEGELLCLATNCAFTGKDFDQLLVANLGHHHLSILDLRTKGQPLWNHQRATLSGDGSCERPGWRKCET